MITVFAHPGRRFGQLVETLLLAVLGAFLGIAWSILGVYVGSLLGSNTAAMFAVRALFLIAALCFHGFLRSHTPRLFTFVLLEIIVCITGLTTTDYNLTHSFVTDLVYPVLLAGVVIFFANLFIFPEFSSDFLGKTTIQTLQDASNTLANAGVYFVSYHSHQDAINLNEARNISASDQPRRGIKLHKLKPNDWSNRHALQPTNHVRAGNEGSASHMISLKSLTASKSKLRSSLAKQDAAQDETQFELAFSTLPPRDLQRISKSAMKRLVANTIAVVGACESRYALLGETLEDTRPRTRDAEVENQVSSSSETSIYSRETSGILDGTNLIDIKLVRPKKEIEFGDVHVFRGLIRKIAKPYHELQEACNLTVNAIISGLSLCYVSVCCSLQIPSLFLSRLHNYLPKLGDLRVFGMRSLIFILTTCNKHYNDLTKRAHRSWRLVHP